MLPNPAIPGANAAISDYQHPSICGVDCRDGLVCHADSMGIRRDDLGLLFVLGIRRGLIQINRLPATGAKNRQARSFPASIKPLST